MAKVKICIITGFLGSGKTTLLSQILKRARESGTGWAGTAAGAADGGGGVAGVAGGEDALAGLALLVNEFGEVGLDEELLRADFAAETLLLGAGCACCNKREDLILALRELLERAEAAGKPLRRVLIETTGLARPGPIFWTILNDPFLAHHFEPAGLFACVDGLVGHSHLAQAEAAEQLIAAEAIILTKTQLQGDKAYLARLKHRLRELNATAKIYEGEGPNLEELFSPMPERDLGNIFEKNISKNEDRPGEAHLAKVGSLALILKRPIEWNAFAVWLSALLARHGESMLRVKGLIDLGEELIAINALNHIVCPPSHIKKATPSQPSGQATEPASPTPQTGANDPADFASAGARSPKTGATTPSAPAGLGNFAPASSQLLPARPQAPECKIVFIAKGLDLGLVRESFEVFLRGIN